MLNTEKFILILYFFDKDNKIHLDFIDHFNKNYWKINTPKSSYPRTPKKSARCCWNHISPKVICKEKGVFDGSG